MARLLMLTLALGLVAWAVWLWPDVPARVPVHFDPGGAPDRWAARSVGSWFALPLVALAVAAALDALMRWALRHPESPMLNLPDKEALLALPPERRAPVLARVAEMTYAIGALSVAACALIQVGVWTTARGADGSGWVLAGGLTVILGSLAVLVWGLVRVQAELTRQQALGYASLGSERRSPPRPAPP